MARMLTVGQIRRALADADDRELVCLTLYGRTDLLLAHGIALRLNQILPATPDRLSPHLCRALVQVEVIRSEPADPDAIEF